MDDDPQPAPHEDSSGDNSDGDNSGGGETPESQRPPGSVHGSFRVDHRTARLPKSVGHGEFANALMVAAGPLEFILDFVQRLGEPARVVARVVLPPFVARQFVQALEHNIGLYEQQFGSMPTLPTPRTQQTDPTANESARSESAVQTDDVPPEAADPPPPPPSVGQSGGIAGAGIEPQSAPPAGAQQRPIEDIYDELKLDDEMLSGRYANAVIVRHSPAEFAFEFIARFMPHSVVSARVIVAAPNVPNLLTSLRQAIADHSRRQPPGRGDLHPSDN